MLKNFVQTVIFGAGLSMVSVWSCAAQEQATVVFKSGLIVTVDNAYKALVDAMKRGDKGGVTEINVQGNQFLIKMEEVAVVCRDRCLPMTVVSPARR